MPTIMTSTDQLNKVYDQFKDKFEANCSPSFHNLLWQLIINRVHDDKIIVLVPAVMKHDRWEVGLAEHNEPGFIATSVGLLSGIDYKEATWICEKLSKQLFGIDEKLWATILLSSMRSKKPDDELNEEQLTTIRWHLSNNVMPSLTPETQDKIIADINAVRTGRKELTEKIGNSDCTIGEMVEDLRLWEFLDADVKY